MDLLQDKRQVILYEPPGTAKTYLAQVAETTITAYRRGDKLSGDNDAPAKLRLIVARTRLLSTQTEL